MKGWIGFDLDGTLARYDTWKGPLHIGEPIPEMVELVKYYLSKGQQVRIFTARVSGLREGAEPNESRKAISDWCLQHIGARLPITCVKDFHMILLYDDRAVQVVTNEGRIVANVF